MFEWRTPAGEEDAADIWELDAKTGQHRVFFASASK